jgi:hypothetical protein
MRRAGLAAGLVVVLGAAGLGLVWLGRDRASDPPHPKEWDARVLPLVRFVEHQRGLRFRHPVTVEYLSDADFRREVADEPGETAQQQRDDEAADRALGLPVGKSGLAASGSTLSGEGITAYYDDQTAKVDVRGTDLTVYRRATIVHELTHALQDQHFDLSREGSYRSDDRNAAFDAVVEGDAVRTENAWVDSLPQADQDAYDKEDAEGDAAYGAGVADVPDWLSAQTDFPYSVGEAFTEVLAADGGEDAVDRALRTPPAAVADTMDPARARRGDRPVPVPVPAAPTGDRVAKRNDLGELRWLLVLAERIPSADALRAADGWAGDAYVAYEHQGRVCVRADVAALRPAAGDELIRALDRWTATMPATAGATVSRTGTGLVEVASCDPGAAALPGSEVPGSHVDEAMKLVDDRVAAAAGQPGAKEATVSTR